MRNLLFFYALELLAFGCQPAPPAPVPPDQIVTDASPPEPAPPVLDATPEPPPPHALVDAGDIFDQACENLHRLHCDEGFDKPGQQPCATVMRHAETSHLTQTHPDCVAGAIAVSAVRACGRYCKIVRP